jgi:2-polyprenyl-6-methoxyphenol hydroxylase-like FAD-dependent oxidoreductase
MQSSADIAILGAGPAAIATGCALRRLGHEVMLIGRSRTRAVEGMSERTLTLLRQNGLESAAQAVRGPAERTGAWAGEAVPGGAEYIVDRAELDAALLADAAAHSVPIRGERVLGYECQETHWQVRTEGGTVLCRTLVDARGRRAQRPVRRGPELIAVCQRFQLQDVGQRLTRLEATDHGWCWLAIDGGLGWLQVTSSRQAPSLRLGLRQHLAHFLAAAPQMAAILSGALALGAPVARAATATLSAEPQGPGAQRVGDAAATLDPLSGQGVYEALRAAHIATAAAHTYLLSGQWQPIRQFLRERTCELWERRNATAALHYQRQAQSTPSAFWSGAAAPYSSAGSPHAGEFQAPHLEWRPVLNGVRIEPRRVLVSPRFPRGIWQLESIDLPELIDILHKFGGDIECASQQLSRPAPSVARAVKWLRAQGLRVAADAAQPSRGI